MDVRIEYVFKEVVKGISRIKNTISSEMEIIRVNYHLDPENKNLSSIFGVNKSGRLL